LAASRYYRDEPRRDYSYENFEEYRKYEEGYEYTDYDYSPEENNGEGVVGKLGLRVVYEDPEILVVTAPNEDELRNIILNLLREKPMSVKEIHSILAGIASEDKIRKSLMRLAEEGVVMMDEDGRYRLLGLL